MKRLFLLATIVAAAAGCMTSPHDQRSVADRNTELTFQGFYPGDAEIRVLAENPANGAFDQLTTARPSMGTGFGPDNNFYMWTVRGTIPNQYWVPGFRGYRARVRSMVGNTHLMSVNSNWLSCYTQNDSDPVKFGNNCASDNSPIAEVFTSDYCAEEPSWIFRYALHGSFQNFSGRRYAILRVGVTSSHPDGAVADIFGHIPDGIGSYYQECNLTSSEPDSSGGTRMHFNCRMLIGDGHYFANDCEYLSWLREARLSVSTRRPLGLGTSCEQDGDYRGSNMTLFEVPHHSIPNNPNHCNQPPPPPPPPGDDDDQQTTIVAFCECDVTGDFGTFIENRHAPPECTRDGYPALLAATSACSRLAPSQNGPFFTSQCRMINWVVTNPDMCILP